MNESELQLLFEEIQKLKDEVQRSREESQRAIEESQRAREESEKLREEVQRLSEEVQSMRREPRGLKFFGKASVSSAKAALKGVGNSIISSYQQFQADVALWKTNREKASADRKVETARRKAEETQRKADRERTRDHEIGMKKAFAEKERAERRLRFKNGVKQKVTSFKSKIGTVKNSIFMGLGNVDQKIKDAFITAGLYTVSKLADGTERLDDLKSEQIEKFRSWRQMKEEEARKRKEAAENEKREKYWDRVAREEMKREEREREERTRDHEIGMKKAFAEKEREERRLRFKNGIKQKVTSFKSKVGTAKNSIFMGLGNVDQKIKDAFITAGLYTVSKLADGTERLDDLKSEQIAKFYLWREAKKQETSERKKAEDVKRAEETQREADRERNREHATSMAELLDELDAEKKREELWEKEARRVIEQEAKREEIEKRRAEVAQRKAEKTQSKQDRERNREHATSMAELLAEKERGEYDARIEDKLGRLQQEKARLRDAKNRLLNFKQNQTQEQSSGRSR